MINIAICDDDLDVRIYIKSVIVRSFTKEKYEFNYHLFSSGEELIKSQFVFDIIFLDIEMNGIDGIETAKQLREKSRRTKIIYVTGHSKYALDVYAVHPFNYIIKPISERKIIDTVNECVEYLSEAEVNSEVWEFKGINGPVLLKSENVIAFEYTGNRRITVYTQDENYLIKGGISDLFELIDTDSFTSPHKSFIINMVHIDSVNSFVVRMVNGLSVPIAQKKMKEFQREYISFVKKTL